MKEYKIKSIQDKSDRPLYFLYPLVPGDKPHFIEFDSEDEAHQAKLSLGLGSTPDPIKSPSSYRVLNRTFEDKPIYKMLENLAQREEEDINSCCYSGCTGCPIYAEKMNSKL